MPEQPHRLTTLDFEKLQDELIAIQFMVVAMLTPETVPTVVAVNAKLKQIRDEAFAANYWPKPTTP